MSKFIDPIENILNTKIKNESTKFFIESNNSNEFNSSETLKDKKTYKTSKNKCPNCNKKFKGLTRFKCSCGIEFCALCRYPEVHKCNLDKYKNKDELSNNMPAVLPKKIDII